MSSLFCFTGSFINSTTLVRTNKKHTKQSISQSFLFFLSCFHWKQNSLDQMNFCTLWSSVEVRAGTKQSCLKIFVSDWPVGNFLSSDENALDRIYFTAGCPFTLTDLWPFLQWLPAYKHTIHQPAVWIKDVFIPKDGLQQHKSTKSALRLVGLVICHNYITKSTVDVSLTHQSWPTACYPKEKKLHGK